MKFITYILRLIVSIFLSLVIGIALIWLCDKFMAANAIYIPRVIRTFFMFNTQDVIQNVYREQMIPGWGMISSIINDPAWAYRTALFVTYVAAIIGLIVINLGVVLLSKVIGKRKPIAITSGLIISLLSFLEIRSMFLGETADMLNITTGFWYYLLVIILTLILIVINFIIYSICLGEFDN